MIWMQKQKRISSIWKFRIGIEAMFDLKLPDASSVKPIKADSCAVGKGWISPPWLPLCGLVFGFDSPIYFQAIAIARQYIGFQILRSLFIFADVFLDRCAFQSIGSKTF
jgi:hypothetical protein